MTRLNDILYTAFSELVAEEGSGDDHPSLDELARYLNHDLEEGRREEVQQHFLRCRNCLQLALDAVSFPNTQPPSDDLRLSPDEVHRRWSRLQERLAEEISPVRRRRRTKLVRIFTPLAASLAFVAIGALALWTGLVPRNQSNSITVNTRIYSLSPETADNTSRSVHGSTAPDAAQVIELSPQYDAILLILNVSSFEEATGYEAELLRVGETEPIWNSATINRTEDLNFNVTLPRSSLEAGSYILELNSDSPKGRTRIARYRLELVKPQ